jgi:hypothetical protein
MITRVPEQPALARLDPLLDSGPETDFVPKYLTMPEVQRPAAGIQEFPEQIERADADQLTRLQAAILDC